MARLRLGVAVIVPEPVRSEVQGLRKALGDPALGRIEPHITLVSPFNVAAESLDLVIRRLVKATVQTEPFEVVLGGARTFMPHSPVLYLSVLEGVAELAQLVVALHQPPLPNQPRRDYVAHVTLAEELPLPRLFYAADFLGGYRARFLVNSVSLLCRPAGRPWEPIEVVALGEATTRAKGGLEIELWSGPELPPDAASWLATKMPCLAPLAPQHACVVARRHGSVVGVARAAVRPCGDLEAFFVWVDEASRMQGVGSQMMRELTALAGRWKCLRVVVLVRTGSPEESWLSHLGFRPAECHSEEGWEKVCLRLT